jgi:hypothetical protein
MLSVEARALLQHHTTSFTLATLKSQPFLERALAHEVVAFGEIHGNRESLLVFTQALEALSAAASRVLVLLERDFLEQEVVAAFIRGDDVDLDRALHFSAAPRTAAELSGPRSYLHALRRINLQSPCALAVACIDVAHGLDWHPDEITSEDPRVEVSRDILSVRDEDIFDAAREQFMFQETIKALHREEPQRVLFCGGNGHVSRSSWYFDREGIPELHVPTVVSRLERDPHKTVHAVLFYPVSGQFRYQKNKRLELRTFAPVTADPVLMALSNELRTAGSLSYTDLTSIPPTDPDLEPYQKSWNGIISAGVVTPDAPVGEGGGTSQEGLDHRGELSP